MNLNVDFSGDQITTEDVALALSLVMEQAPDASLLCRFSYTQLRQAYEWAMTEHLYASDSEIERIIKPAFLSDFK